MSAPTTTPLDEVVSVLAAAPLSLVPIRFLAVHADRDVLGMWFEGWEAAGLARVVPHLDAVHVLDRDTFIALAAGEEL